MWGNMMEFTKPQRRGQRQRRLKLNLYFSAESCDTLKLFTLFLTVKTITKLNAKHSDKFEIKIKRIVRRGLRSPENTDLGYLNVLAQPLFCSLIHLFSSVAVTVAVAVLVREFKKLLQRRRRQRRLKNEFVFYLRISGYSYAIEFVYHCQSYRETESGTR